MFLSKYPYVNLESSYRIYVRVPPPVTDFLPRFVLNLSPQKTLDLFRPRVLV